MRLFYARGISVLGLMALYLFYPVAAVVVLAGGYTYVLLRARSQRDAQTESFVSLHLS